MATLPEALSIALQHHQAGRLQAAEQIYRQILQVDPNHAEALHLLGGIALQVGKPELGVDYISRAIASNGTVAEFRLSLGKAYHALGRIPEAGGSYRIAIELKPDFPEAHISLGNACKEEGKIDEAIDSYRRALALAPGSAEAHNNLGVALRGQGKLEEAAACYRQAIEVKPAFAEAHNNLGNLRMEQGALDGAIDCYGRALAHAPRFVAAHYNMGLALKDQARLDEAIASFRRALALEPRNGEIHSALINTLLFHPRHDSASWHEAHGHWSRQLVEPLQKSIRPHRHDRNPERPLRIGYISPDFRDHVAGRYALPLIERHDRARFSVYCYANVAEPDALTRRFQAASYEWRDIVATPDEAVAELIRADGIDILVDLTMHMARSRLLVSARKPAPVQVCWLGYPGTSGLSAIDYRLTDPYLDPPDAPDPYSSETPVRLPHSFWCYDPPACAPPVNPLPALSAGRVTFGSLNHFCKLNEVALALWARVLGAVKDSRLLLLSKEGSHRQRTEREFARLGIASDRIEWFSPAPQPEYLAAYHRIDLGLDSFPYNGHTTSLDSCWMGVPVVTLVGQTIVGRAGLSQAMNLGLPELIARTPEQYVQIAADLAHNLPRLAELRATLRERMNSSPLMDASQFTRDVEAAYREMWRRWCRG